MRRPESDPAVLITSAMQSSEDEFEHRRRKYALMMGIRALAVLAAALFYEVSIWISLVCLVAGAALPWCAVLIANDGPAKKRAKVVGHPITPGERSLPAVNTARTVDAEPTDVRTDPS